MPILVMALLVMTAVATTLDVGDAESAWLDTVVRRPFIACMVLLGVAVFAVRRRQQLAAVAAGCAAGVLASLEVGWTAIGDAAAIAEQMPAIAAMSIACGIAAKHLVRRPHARFTILATANFVGLAACFASLVAAAVGLRPGAQVSDALGVMAVSVALFDNQRRALGGIKIKQALEWLIVPALIAGSTSAALLCCLVWTRPDLTQPERLQWIGIVLTAAVVLNAALFGGLRAASRAMLARNLAKKLRRVLRRQREVVRQRAAALRQARFQYDQLFISVPAAVLLTDPDGAIVAANPAMTRLLGVESEGAIKAKNFAEFYANPDERRKLIDAWHTSGSERREGEVTLRRVDGELLHAVYAGRLITDSTGQVQYQQGTFADVTPLRREETRRRKLESQLRLSQKLESVGRLAAGVAHEINTPMQYVGDTVYFLRGAFDGVEKYVAAARGSVVRALASGTTDDLRDLQTLEREIEIDDVLDNVPRAFERAAEGIQSVTRIVAAMKELAHPDQGSKSSTDVNALIETALVVSKHEYKTLATIEKALGNVPFVLAYKTELCQVLINLIVNSAHAIETAKIRDHRAGMIRIETESSAGSVFIRVHDNGCGIPEAVRDKIFDPFFTTKDVGKGTGQGLAMARATIVDKHAGELTVHSTVGVGSTFTITLPLGSEGGAPAKENA